ncbi:DUF6083 domain-containing protein [Streptomyces hyaluromycini]|uniref:DUF6083 domain-containing protein n=1 Tax=Streptomyces hyaluromycini TaxID=1377993 RepID=A0ABV1WQI2_9ACTN
MGVFGEEPVLPQQQPGELDAAYWGRVERLTDRVQAREEGADAPAPPAASVCPQCGLAADRFPTRSKAWVFLEALEPAAEVPAHMVPPFFRWLISQDGVAWCPGDAEPAPGATCRVPHRLVCPGVDWSKPWSWLAAVREENARKAQFLYNPPRLPDSSGEGVSSA